jgi:hypothetical protein
VAVEKVVIPLSLEAATRQTGIKRLALYEAPFIVDDNRVTTEDDWTQVRERTLEGQTHMVNAKVQTPILVEVVSGENADPEFALGAASLA